MSFGLIGGIGSSLRLQVFASVGHAVNDPDRKSFYSSKVPEFAAGPLTGTLPATTLSAPAADELSNLPDMNGRSIMAAHKQ